MKAEFDIELQVTIKIDLEKFCALALERDFPDRYDVDVDESASELDYALAVARAMIDQSLDDVDWLIPGGEVTDVNSHTWAKLAWCNVTELQFRDFLMNSRPEAVEYSSRQPTIF